MELEGAAEPRRGLQVEREIKIHSQLFHQNIVSLFAAFEDADHVYLAQEYAAGPQTASLLILHSAALVHWPLSASTS